MATRIILITQFDRQRLKDLIREANYSSSYRGSEYLKNLDKELDRGQVVTPREIPPDVITMNSKVRLEDVETGEEMIYTLVFPPDADLAQNKISILAPIGTAMLGYRVGDIFEWPVPGGTARIKVKEIIFQPEASGNYDL